jgi:hypothetical protein
MDAKQHANIHIHYTFLLLLGIGHFLNGLVLRFQIWIIILEGNNTEEIALLKRPRELRFCIFFFYVEAFLRKSRKFIPISAALIIFLSFPAIIIFWT